MDKVGGGDEGQREEEEEERDTGPEELQTDTSLLMASVYVSDLTKCVCFYACLESRACVSSSCG